MATFEMPMNSAHEHAALAEDAMAKGLFIPASEQHNLAAEAYMAAHARSNDESAKRTLMLLYNDHHKAAKDLERRIEKLKSKGIDPSLPQLSQKPHLSSNRPNVGQSSRASMPSSPTVQKTMTDTIDDSFMILQGHKSDPGDSFNQFWNIMQGMLENLSQPVAFATAPLGPTAENGRAATPPGIPREGSLGSDTDDEPIVSRISRRLGMSSRLQGRSSGNSSLLKASNNEEDFEDDLVLDEDGDELSESFLFVSSNSDDSASTLRKENIALKSDMETMRKRLDATERVLELRKEQDAHLRDSIYQATREAHRALGGRTQLDSSSLNINHGGPGSPMAGFQTGREAQYARRVNELERRVRELEEELRVVRLDSDKHKAMNAKYRERWDKLKASNRKKKEAKAKAEISKERIDEEPEAEKDS